MVKTMSLIGLLIVITIVLLSQMGCASILSSSRASMTFISRPSNATIEAGDVRGNTTVTLPVKKGTGAVSCYKSGYKAQSQSINTSFMDGYLVLDILLTLLTPGYGLTAIIIDSCTGAWNDLPSSMYFELEKESNNTNEDKSPVDKKEKP